MKRANRNENEDDRARVKSRSSIHQKLADSALRLRLCNREQDLEACGRPGRADLPMSRATGILTLT